MYKYKAPLDLSRLTLKDGPNSGDVRVIVKAVEAVVAYNFIYAKDAIPTTAAGWSKVYTSTRAYYDFVGLTAGRITIFVWRLSVQREFQITPTPSVNWSINTHCLPRSH